MWATCETAKAFITRPKYCWKYFIFLLIRTRNFKIFRLNAGQYTKYKTVTFNLNKLLWLWIIYDLPTFPENVLPLFAKNSLVSSWKLLFECNVQSTLQHIVYKVSGFMMTKTGQLQAQLAHKNKYSFKSFFTTVFVRFSFKCTLFVVSVIFIKSWRVEKLCYEFNLGSFVFVVLVCFEVLRE